MNDPAVDASRTYFTFEYHTSFMDQIDFYQGEAYIEPLPRWDHDEYYYVELVKPQRMGLGFASSLEKVKEIASSVCHKLQLVGEEIQND